jgi:hypothetical protein
VACICAALSSLLKSGSVVVCLVRLVFNRLKPLSITRLHFDACKGHFNVEYRFH